MREREAAESLVVLRDLAWVREREVGERGEGERGSGEPGRARRPYLVAHHAVVPAVLGLQVLEAQQHVLEGQGLGGEAAFRVPRGVVLGMRGGGERGGEAGECKKAWKGWEGQAAGQRSAGQSGREETGARGGRWA